MRQAMRLVVKQIWCSVGTVCQFTKSPVQLQGSAFTFTWWLREVLVHKGMIRHCSWPHQNSSSIPQPT